MPLSRQDIFEKTNAEVDRVAIAAVGRLVLFAVLIRVGFAGLWQSPLSGWTKVAITAFVLVLIRAAAALGKFLDGLNSEVNGCRLAVERLLRHEAAGETEDLRLQLNQEQIDAVRLEELNSLRASREGVLLSLIVFWTVVALVAGVLLLV